MPLYSKDPRWITVRYAGKCSRCSKPIQQLEQAFYYPNGRKMLCNSPECGDAASREFDSACQDEAFYASQY